MHEYSLYGQVASEKHDVLLQQLAGVARMQPKYVKELHLVFESTIPAGLRLIPSATNSDRIQNPEIQRLSKMLTNTLHYVQVVGTIEEQPSAKSNGDTEMTNSGSNPLSHGKIQWRLEFKDTPDPGKSVVTIRQVATIPIEDGDVMMFMRAFGFTYSSRYFIEGAKFYDQNTTLFLHRPHKVPTVEQGKATDTSFLDSPADMQLLDGSGAYLLQASIETTDGSVGELKDRATRQLLAMKEILKHAVGLVPGDRLALDTRISMRARP